MKVAVIGCGTIANSMHIPSYLNCKDAEIKYFCDIIHERADEAVKKYGCGKAVYNYKKILDDPEIEAVSVCTPNKMHSKIAIDFLRHGKNVLCEKPAAINLKEALKMQQVQHETGKVLNIGVVNRFNASVNMIKKYIDEGKLGKVYHVYASFRAYRSIPGLGGAFTTKAIAGGGALIDWGVHFIDIVMYCTSDPTPLSVNGDTFCELGRDIPSYVYRKMWAGPPVLDGICDVEESVSAMVRTSGPTVTIHGAWAQNIDKSEMFIDFMGDKGGVRLMYGKGFTYYGVKDGQLFSEEPEIDTENMLAKSFQNEIDSFIRCIKTGEKLPSHIDNVIPSAKIIQGIYDSSAKKKEIRLAK